MVTALPSLASHKPCGTVVRVNASLEKRRHCEAALRQTTRSAASGGVGAARRPEGSRRRNQFAGAFWPDFVRPTVALCEGYLEKPVSSFQNAPIGRQINCLLVVGWVGDTGVSRG